MFSLSERDRLPPGYHSRAYVRTRPETTDNENSGDIRLLVDHRKWGETPGITDRRFLVPPFPGSNPGAPASFPIENLLRGACGWGFRTYDPVLKGGLSWTSPGRLRSRRGAGAANGSPGPCGRTRSSRLPSRRGSRRCG